jgi:putative Mn2+ efflux pump MntP
MQEIISIFLIGISLSLDTFSLSLSLSPIFSNTKYNNLFPLIVGIFHFIMPNIGNFAGIKLIQILNLASNILLGLILIFLGLNLLISQVKEEEPKVKLSILGVTFLALSVSVDSFTVGLGLSNLSSSNILSSFIFAICSFTFTNLGLIIGKYSQKHIGKYANILGIILLFILGIYHLLY